MGLIHEYDGTVEASLLLGSSLSQKISILTSSDILQVYHGEKPCKCIIGEELQFCIGRK